jgi:ribosomal protein L7/L12
MALIKCPECSNEISDKAIACPKCGYPLQPGSQPQPADSDLQARIKQTLIDEGPIAAIKLYRQKVSGSGLLEAKRFVEQIQATLPPGTTTKPKPRSQGCLVLITFIIASLAIAVWSIAR